MFGNAKAPTTPHGMIHELVDKTEITDQLESSKKITLDSKSLRKHFTDDKLKVLIGTILTDGSVTYRETDLNLKK